MDKWPNNCNIYEMDGSMEVPQTATAMGQGSNPSNQLKTG